MNSTNLRCTHENTLDPEAMARRVCVIGAGITGLSTAIQIQQTIPDVTVTIITEHVSPNTTGDGSGGFWLPHLFGDTPLSKLRKWGAETFKHMVSIVDSTDASVAGAFMLSGYTVFREKEEDPFWKDIPFGYRHMTKSELDRYPGYKFGYHFTTVVGETKMYLPWLQERFQGLGGKLLRRKINEFEELKHDFDVIVNCTGMGSRELCKDNLLVPTQGQVTRVRAPWIKTFLIVTENRPVYIVPGIDCVILGGTGNKGRYDTNVDQSEKERIFKDCCKLIPSLKDAQHLEDWVGLRPTRKEIRLERENRLSEDKLIKVVHNYGHGGGGVTLHWGCAKEAAQLVKEALNESHSTKL